ncbi:hypothetical protein CJF30_00010620 [Rutstroemia sp. NJR-2017a BBW]|nr:hypothetical protein CJF30_00010620 [Rutstroemia sp. NJR-2017a BBW]
MSDPGPEQHSPVGKTTVVPPPSMAYHPDIEVDSNYIVRAYPLSAALWLHAHLCGSKIEVGKILTLDALGVRQFLFVKAFMTTWKKMVALTMRSMPEVSLPRHVTTLLPYLN